MIEKIRIRCLVFVPYSGDLFLINFVNLAKNPDLMLVFVPYSGDLFLILYPGAPILPCSVEHFAAGIAFCTHEASSFRELAPIFRDSMGIGGDLAFSLLYKYFKVRTSSCQMKFGLFFLPILAHSPRPTAHGS